MAAGNVVFYEQFYVDVLEGIHDLENDTINLGLVSATYTPTAADADPRWGAGGTTDTSTNEVTPGGNYPAGGLNVANPSVTLVLGEGEFDADDVSALQNVSNPSGARWGILYNNTAVGKQAIGYLDLGSVIDLSAGDFSVAWDVNGIARLGAAP